MRPHLSVVVPTYNEEQRIGAFISEIAAEATRLGVSCEVVVADDGSGDRTREIVRTVAAGDGRVRLVEAPHRGKGAAVRRGFAAARGNWIFMADADLSMPPDNLERFLDAVRRPPVPHIVIGSREASGAKRIDEPWSRHMIGRLFNLLVQAVAVPGIHDTQCGYKLLSADAVTTLTPHLTIDGFAFDVELLMLARRAGFDVREVGITWYCRRDTRVRMGRGAAAFMDVVRVRLNAARGQYAALDRVAPRESPLPLSTAG